MIRFLPLALVLSLALGACNEQKPAAGPGAPGGAAPPPPQVG
jgi:hypothetical protein